MTQQAIMFIRLVRNNRLSMINLLLPLTKITTRGKNRLLSTAVNCGRVLMSRLLLVLGAKIDKSIMLLDRRERCSILRIHKSTQSLKQKRGPVPIFSNTDRAFLREILLCVGMRLNYIFPRALQWSLLSFFTYKATFLWYPDCLNFEFVKNSEDSSVLSKTLCESYIYKELKYPWASMSKKRKNECLYDE